MYKNPQCEKVVELSSSSGHLAPWAARSTPGLDLFILEVVGPDGKNWIKTKLRKTLFLSV